MPCRRRFCCRARAHLWAPRCKFQAQSACEQARTDADTADSGGVSEADIVRVLREAAAANTPVKSSTLTKAFRAQVLLHSTCRVLQGWLPASCAKVPENRHAELSGSDRCLCGACS